MDPNPGIAHREPFVSRSIDLTHAFSSSYSVYNNLSPSWSTVVFVDGFKFGVPFYIEVGVFDFDSNKVGKKERELAKKSSVANVKITATKSSRDLYRTGRLPHKVMGTALFEVGALLAARGNVMSKSLQTGGAIYVHLERSRDEGETGNVRLQLQGVGLVNTQRLSFTSSPFFEMYRKVERPTGAVWYVAVQRDGSQDGRHTSFAHFLLCVFPILGVVSIDPTLCGRI